MSSYIDTGPRRSPGHYYPGHSWEEHCSRRLVHAHGPERAQRIDDGKDPATERDLAAWRTFGLSKSGAA